MFNFLKKKKKVNIIADRIKNLNDKLWLISITGREKNVISKVRYLKTNGKGFNREYRVMFLNTYYGEREIAVDDDTLYYGNKGLIQESDKLDDWSFNFNYLFYIRLDKDNVEIKFSDGLKMTKEEVDLAILEFEVAVDNMYVRMTKTEESYDDIIDYLMNGAEC